MHSSHRYRNDYILLNYLFLNLKKIRTLCGCGWGVGRAFILPGDRMESFLKGYFFFFNFFFFLSLLFFFIYLFIYLLIFMAVLGLRFCARAFSNCGKWGPLFIAVRGPLTIAASLVAEHRLQTHRLSSCGSRA